MKVGRHMWRRLLPMVLVLVTMFAAIAIAEEPRFSVSGTVSYGGAKNGRIYISASGFSNMSYGVSLSAPGPFKIEGLPPGDYQLSAFMDTTGTGQPHAFDPSEVTPNFRIDNYSPTNKTILLRDPEAIAPQPPEFLTVRPVGTGVLVEWDPPEDDYGRVTVESFNVYWSTSSDVSPVNVTGGGERKGIVAGDESFLIIPGLQENTPYYFVVTSSLNGVESAPSSYQKITLLPQSSGNTVSGTLSFSNVVPEGTLYIVVEDVNDQFFIAAVPNPTNPQAFTVAGVADGKYKIFAFLDMNNNGIADPGDVMDGDEGAPEVTVSGAPVSDVKVSLVKKNVRSLIRTNHWRYGIDGDSYSIDLEVEQGAKQPVNIKLVTAPVANNYPTVATPIDIGLNDWGQFHGSFPVALRPGVGQVYTVQVSYADGTSEDVPLAITGVVDTFAKPLSPVGNVNYDAKPTLTWEAPQQAPAEYGYHLSLHGGSQFGNNSWINWWAEDLLPSNQLSATYNFDNDEWAPAELPDNGSYTWQIGVVDSFGNASYQQASFSYGYGSITGKVTDVNNQPIGGVQVYLTDLNGTPVDWSWGVTTTPDGFYKITAPGGEYKVHFIGAQGGFISEWYNDAAEAPAAATVTVVSNTDTTGIDAVLALAQGQQTHTQISGKVLSSVTGAGVKDISVQLFNTNGESVGMMYTDADGNYTLNYVQPGTYNIFFSGIKLGGACQDEWYLDADLAVSGTAVTVGSEPMTVQTATLACQAVQPQNNTLSGYIKDGATMTGIGDAHVNIFNAQKELVVQAVTDGSGYYTIPSIPDGSYYIEYSSWGCADKWFENAEVIDQATLFTMNGGLNFPLDAVLNCTVVQPKPLFTVQPIPVDFSSVYVGQPSGSQTITITSTHDQTVTLAEPVVTGDDGFEVVSGGNNPCAFPHILQPNEFCTLSATLQPSSEGAKKGTLSIFGTSTNSEQTSDILLQGNGVIEYVQPLAVNYTFPADGAEGIAINGPVLAGFSGYVNNSSVTDKTFTLTTQGGTTVAGTVYYDGEDAVFLPSASLAPSTVYTGKLSSEITDSNGTKLSEDYTWTFTTGVQTKTFFSNLKGTGIYNIEDDSYEKMYGKMKVADDGTMTQQDFIFNGSTWDLATSGYSAYFLTANGWKEYADDASAGTLVVNAEGTTGTWTNKYDGAAMTIVAAEYDLAGQSFTGYMSPEAWTYREDGVFPEGAKGYVMKMTSLADTYRVYKWNDGESETDYNYVSYWNNQTNQEVTVKTLNELQTAFSYGEQNQKLWIGEGLSAQLYPAVNSATTGKVQLYLEPMQYMESPAYANGPTPVSQQATWKLELVKGQIVLRLTDIPAAQQPLLDEGSDVFFAVVNGVVKRGEYTKAGKSKFDGDGLAYNKTAWEAVLGDLVPVTTGFTVTVTNATPEGGAVTSSPEGIDCGDSTCEAVFEADSSVILTAKAVTGWAFDGWTGCTTSTGATCTVAVTDDKTVTAKFRKTDVTAPNTTITTKPVTPSGTSDATFGFTATEPAFFECSVDDPENFVPCGEETAAITGLFTYEYIEDGEHTFYVRATDQAGNTDATAAAYKWTIDTEIPVLSVTPGVEEMTKVRVATFTVLPEGGVAKYRYTLDGTEFAARAVASKITTAALADGDHELTVIGISQTGVESDPYVYNWSVDTTAPVTTIDDKPALFSNQREGSFLFSSLAEDVDKFECKLDKGLFEECFGDFAYEALIDGKHTFTVRATDAAGNVEKGIVYTWTIDATPPEVTVKGAPAPGKVVRGNSINLTIGGKGVVAYAYRLGDTDYGDEIDVKTPLALTGLPDGENEIYVIGRDLAGNWQVETDLPQAIVNLDNTAPEAVVTGAPEGLTNLKKTAIVVSSDGGVVGYKYRLDGGAWVGGAKGIAVAKPIAISLKTKAYTLEVIGVDAAGNWQAAATEVFSWTSDVTLPKVVLTKPSSSTVLEGAETALAFAVPLGSEPNGVSYSCKLDLEPSYSPCDSPYLLGQESIGPHTLYVMAEDEAGNLSKAVSYKWTVKAAPQ